jgi:hypothetical protein
MEWLNGVVGPLNQEVHSDGYLPSTCGSTHHQHRQAKSRREQSATSAAGLRWARVLFRLCALRGGESLKTRPRSLQLTRRGPPSSAPPRSQRRRPRSCGVRQSPPPSSGRSVEERTPPSLANPSIAASSRGRRLRRAPRPHGDVRDLTAGEIERGESSVLAFQQGPRRLVMVVLGIEGGEQDARVEKQRRHGLGRVALTCSAA